MIATCLAYLGWLSPKLLGFLLGFLVVGLALVSLAGRPRLFLRPPLA